MQTAGYSIHIWHCFSVKNTDYKFSYSHYIFGLCSFQYNIVKYIKVKIGRGISDAAVTAITIFVLLHGQSNKISPGRPLELPQREWPLLQGAA